MTEYEVVDASGFVKVKTECSILLSRSYPMIGACLFAVGTRRNGRAALAESNKDQYCSLQEE